MELQRPEGNPHLYDPEKAAQLHTFYVRKMKERKEHAEGHHHRSAPTDASRADKAIHKHRLILKGGEDGVQHEEAKADSTPDRMMESIQKLMANTKIEDMKKAVDEGMRD